MFLTFLKESILWIITAPRVWPKIILQMLQVTGGLLLQNLTVIQTKNGLLWKKVFYSSSKLVRTLIQQIHLPSPGEDLTRPVHSVFTSPVPSVFPVIAWPKKNKEKKEFQNPSGSKCLNFSTYFRWKHCSAPYKLPLRTASSLSQYEIIAPLFLSSIPSPKCPQRMGVSGEACPLRTFGKRCLALSRKSSQQGILHLTGQFQTTRDSLFFN